MNRLEEWAKSTEAHEGFHVPGTPGYPYGSLSYRNNNSGNLRPTSYTYSLGANNGARSGFVWYKTYDIGFKALKQFLFDASTDVLRPYRAKAQQLGKKSTRNLTLQEFYSVYAPSGDNNNPNAYGADIAKRLKVDLKTEIGTLIEEVPPTPVPTPTPSPAGTVISRKQGDPKWGKVTMGNSGETLARYGCLVTSISDALHWMGRDLTPDVLAKTLSFTPQGSLYWNSITEKTGAKFIYRYWTFDKKACDDALKHKTMCVMMEFKYAGARHWAWVIGKDFLGRYKIADPLRGDFALHTRYGSPVGLALIDKK